MKNTSWTKLNKGKYDWLYHYKGIFNFDLFEKVIAENGFVAVSKSRHYTTLKYFLENGSDNGNPNKYERYAPEHDKLWHFECKHKILLGDHDFYFKTKSGECVYISQPYVSKEIAEPIIKEFAELNGVKAKVYDGNYAWYNPTDKDKICLIVVALPNRDVKVYNVRCKGEQD